MSSLTVNRKKREFEEREKVLLKIADGLLSSQGEAVLTMDNLIAHSEYSKGTIYKHFKSKEDLLAAIYFEKFQVLLRIFSKVSSLPLPSRERELGLHVAHSLFDRQYFRESARLMAPNTSAMLEKVSPQRRDKLEELQQKFQNLLLSLIQEAVDAGDLVLTLGLSIDMIALGNQALSFGMMTMMYGMNPDPNAQDMEPFVYIHLEAASRLLDGYNWRPYSDACDFRAVAAKVEAALEDEFQLLRAESQPT